MSRLPNGDVSAFARFMSRINIPADPKDCWTWNGRLSPKGYGEFTHHADGRGRNYRAHRWLYAFLHGSIPDGLVVRHKCDNPRCVSPHHLEIGTQGDNYRDMVERGRRPERLKGERSNLARFTEADVLAMRKQFACGRTYSEIAAAFSTTKSTAYDIVRGRRWAHVQFPDPAASAARPVLQEIAA